MKRVIAPAALGLVLSFGLTACDSADPTQRAPGGAAGGAAAGAALGSVLGNGKNALTGALIGGALGGLGGYATAPNRSGSRYDDPPPPPPEDDDYRR